MEALALIVGLVAAAVVLPALLVLCGTKRKQDAPIGASMANRRGAPGGGILQIDPILQPNWAAKQAERDALEKKQLAVIKASKSARLHKAGAGGIDDHVQVVMRQPSTMADKFALPSHLTKQLCQPSRRGLAPAIPAGAGIRSGTPLQDGSVNVIPPLPDRKSQSSPMYGGYGGSVSSISRSAVNDSSINVSAGGDTPDLLHGRVLNSNTSNGSRRGLAVESAKALRASSAVGPDPVAVGVIPVSDMYPLDGSGSLPRDLREADADRRVTDPQVANSAPFADICSGSGTGIAWPRLNEHSDDDSVHGRRRAVAAAAGAASSISAGGVAATAAAALEGPRLSHPRVMALSPMLGASRARSGSGDGIRTGAKLLHAFQLYQNQQQLQPPTDDDEQRDGAGERQLQRPQSSVDDVEQLVQGVDWAAAPTETESGSRRGSFAGRQVSPLSAPPGSQHHASSILLASDSGGRAAAAAAAAANRPLSRSPNSSIGSGAGGAGGGRTISSRELHVRGAHLPSLLSGRASLGDSRDTRFGAGATISGISKRWTANGGLTPPAPAVVAMAPEFAAPLPGSSENITITGPMPSPSQSSAHPQNSLMTRSHKSLTAMRSSGAGARPESQTWGGGVDSEGERLGRRILSSHANGYEQVSMTTAASASAAATAAAAASATATAAARGTPITLGTPPSSAGVTARGVTTWSGMAMAPLVDVEAGPLAMTSSGDGLPAAMAAARTSRTARAQALLARNRSNLSRLAASTAPQTSETLS